MINVNGTMKNFIKSGINSARKKVTAKNGISNLIEVALSGLGDPQSRGNAAAIYNIFKFLQ